MATSPKKRKPPAKKAPVKKAPAKDLKPGDIRSQYTYKNESPQQSARDLKASDMRQKFAEGPKQSRAAADLKSGDSRSSYLKRASNNPVGDFLKEAQRARQLPVVTEQPNKVRGNPNMARPSKVIKQGYTPGSASRAVVPYQGAAKRGIAAAAGAALRTAVRYAGPVGALVGMTTEVGAGSDKPSGPLFSPSKNRAAGKGNPKAVNPYQATKAKIPARGEARGGMKSTLESYRASKAVKSVASNSYFKEVPSYKGTKAPVSMAGGGPDKRQGSSSPSMAAVPKPKARPARSAAVAPKPKARPNVTPAKGMTFQTAVRRNEAESYTRNKMRPKGNLLDLIRRKK